MTHRPLVLDLLNELVGQLDRHTAAVDLFRLLSTEQILWRPAPEKWSIAHCIDHLTAQNIPYEAPVAAALDRAAAGRNDRPLRMGLWGRLLFDSVDPALMQRRKSKTPPIFRPAPDPELTTLFERFHRAQAALRENIIRAQGVDAQSAKVASPALRLFRFNVATALRILVVHEARHVIQMKNIRNEAGFPV